MLQAHVLITGIVHGVGFRYFVQSNARKLSLSGWVRNTPDGKVEAIFQPSASSGQEAKKQIETMLQLCKKGPFLAEVKNIVVDWEEGSEKMKDFSIQK